VGESLGLFGTMDGRLRGITLNDGKLNWEYYLGGRLVFQPYETDGIVTVANDQGDIAALQTSTGELLWRKRLARDLIGSPILRDGNIISFYSVRGMPSWSAYVYKPK
jgi:outer membrane protein assembly factor BamB